MRMISSHFCSLFSLAIALGKGGSTRGDGAIAMDSRKGSLRRGVRKDSGGTKPQTDALVHLHRGPQLSQSALEATLKHVETHGVPEAFSRRTQSRARHSSACAKTIYGEMVQEMTLPTGAPTSLIHPHPLLYRTAKTCSQFRQLMRGRLQKHPCSRQRPWNIIINIDEVTPTDPCSTKKDAHKIQCVYWSFAEFDELLHLGELWFVAATTPSLGTAELDSGISELLRLTLRKCFFDKDGHDLEGNGVLLDISEAGDGQEEVRLFAKHTYTFCDFLALKEVMCAMGATALKPCPCCQNVVKEDLASGGLLPLSSLDAHLWRRHTDQSVRDIQTYLATQKDILSASAFQQLESRMGYHYRPTSIINDVWYAAISSLRFDWVHTYLQGGVLARELDAFMQLARSNTARGRPAIVSYHDLHHYLSTWTVPARWSSCKNICERGWLTATASDLLSAAPIFQCFFDDIILQEPALGALHNAARCAALACTAIEMLHCAERRLPPAAALHEAIHDHLALHLTVYGREWWVLKHHLAIHIGEHYALDGRLMSTFVTERRHKDPKRFARQAIGVSRGFNKTLIEELACQHLHDMAKTRVFGGIVDSTAPSRRKSCELRDAFPTAREYAMSRVYRADDGAQFAAGDVALLGARLGHACGQIVYHVEVDGVAWTRLEFWPLVERCARIQSHRTQSLCRFVQSRDLRAVVCYRRTSLDVARILLPRRYMYKEGV